MRYELVPQYLRLAMIKSTRLLLVGSRRCVRAYVYMNKVRLGRQRPNIENSGKSHRAETRKVKSPEAIPDRRLRLVQPRV